MRTLRARCTRSACCCLSAGRHARTHTSTQTHAHAHTNTHTNTHARAHTHPAWTHIHTHPRTSARAHTLAPHTRAGASEHTDAYAHKHTQICARASAHMSCCAHSQVSEAQAQLRQSLAIKRRVGLSEVRPIGHAPTDPMRARARSERASASCRVRRKLRRCTSLRSQRWARAPPRWTRRRRSIPLAPRERRRAPRRQGRLCRFQLLKEALRFEREAAPRAATLQQLGRVCIR
jgi:hypothetical protein